MKISLLSRLIFIAWKPRKCTLIIAYQVMAPYCFSHLLQKIRFFFFLITLLDLKGDTFEYRWCNRLKAVAKTR